MSEVASRWSRSWSFVLLCLVPLPGVTAAGDPADQHASSAAVVRFLDLQAVVPSGWLRTQPASAMRLAQFSAASPDGSQSAELVFYYFGPGQGGTPDANIARWRSQFHDAGGIAPEPAVRQFAVSGMAVTRVKLQGSYARGIGAGPGGTGKPGQTLIAAMLQTPRGQVTIQLHGDTALVDAFEAGFDGMLQGIEPTTAH